MGEMKVEASSVAASEARRDGVGLREVIGRLAIAIDEWLGPGDVASLRRLNSSQPGGGAFWRFAANLLDDQMPRVGPGRDAAERAWGAILAGMATTAGLNRGGARAGAALAEAGVSEGRFDRLLRSTGARLADEVRTAARFLASKGARVDWTDVARLVLAADDEIEAARRTLARAYYRALRGKKSGQGKTNS